MFRNAFIFTLLMCFVSFLAESTLAQEFGKVSDEDWAAEPPPSFREVNAMVLFDRGRLEVTTDGITYYQHRRIKVLNQAGADEVGDVKISYYDDDKFKKLKAHTITPDGKKHKVEDVYKQEYGSREARTFSFPAIEPGSIVEYEYRIWHERYGLLDPWYFQSDLFTKVSEFSVMLAPGFNYTVAYKAVPVWGRDPKIEEGGANQDRDRTFTWRLVDQAPVKDEPYMTAVSDYLASMHMQLVSYETPYSYQEFITGWPDLGKSFTKYIGNYTDDDDGVEELTVEVTAGLSDPDEKARAIYEYVAANIRSKDDNTYFTHDDLEKLLEEGYGTSDEKNILLTWMLREADIDANPVLISTRDNATFNPDLYQLRQFNHLIVLAMINDKPLFMDADTKYCPYGLLPPDCLTNGGLLLKGDESMPIRMSAQLPRSIRQDIHYITLDSAGAVTCSTIVRMSGYFTGQYGRLFELAEADEFYDDYFLSKLDNEYELTNKSFEWDREKEQCVVNMTYTVGDLVEEFDENMLLQPPMMYLSENPFETNQRHFPVDFAFPFTYLNQVIVTGSDSLIPVEMPEEVRLQGNDREFVRSATAESGLIRVESKLMLNRAVYNKKEYPDLRQFFVEMETALADEVVLTAN